MTINEAGTVVTSLSDENTLAKEAEIWPGGIPDNNPKCDYDGSDCLPGTDMAMWEFRLGFLRYLIGSKIDQLKTI